jgi:nucleotide-binding universal stress UspA family protein
LQERATSALIPLKNILYATDFSGHSNEALPYALSIARRYGSKVFAVHVVSLSPFPSSSPTIALQAVAAQAVREAKEAMAKLGPQLEAIRHKVLIRKGAVLKELSRIVDEERIDLIVVGTHGRTGISKVLMGSVAEEIFRQAPCPVLTVGPSVCSEPDVAMEMRTILYPTDFSPESLLAAPYAISMAQEHQARLYLLHVTGSPVDKATETSLKERLLCLIPQEAKFWCEPKAHVDFGSASEKIVSLGEELAVDLIVLGVKTTPRLAGASRHLATATAYRVVSRALCPVLTVRAQRPSERRHASQ